METVYINKKTKGIIDQSSILHNDDNKIIVTNTNCWQLIPKNEIEIHIFGGSDEIYEQLFPKTGEIINKEFGALKKIYNKKDMFSFFKKNLDVI